MIFWSALLCLLDDPSPRTPAAVRQAYLAAAADARAWPAAWRTVTTWLATAPETATVRLRVEAYAAALRVLRARDARAPWEKLHHLRAGMGQLDRLVARAPDDTEVRLLRFLSVVYLPEFLGFGERRRRDAAVLARRLPADSLDLPSELAAGVYRLLLERGDLSREERERLLAARTAGRERRP